MMTAVRIDGRAIAFKRREAIVKGVANFTRRKGYAPGLAVVLVGDHPASQVYVGMKRKACADVGIHSEVHALPASISQETILQKIASLNADGRIHGILVQLPLPPSIDSWDVISHISPGKDVDGLHPHNLGLLLAGRPNLIPCTPLGCLSLIKSVMATLAGKRAVVVGRSLLVGRPMALLLSAENATVVQAHSHTIDLAEECRRADILVSAVGKPGLITQHHVKPGAVVIDVGTTRVVMPDGTSLIKGDVAFEEVQEIAGFLTPMPGGVGPMTVVTLLANTLAAAMKDLV
jgi:methylenetetrahydrofolate dehydrogenase (NADP+)/methenyltetrahydrofolate cyclohydrolase